ncbi:uncharacterized protein LOC131246555 [Magnolia sinica]|uniref:uncharacterized protein LOC131246555 n=1 Tax=Magnolia sinica TaxID=86752 RepID=UPI002659982B|nr:uncharacterized protein LOC131246555 [Magnolia sinica]
MDCLRRIISIEQISVDNLECALDMNGIGHIGNQIVPSAKEVICPAPRRPARVPYTLDGLDRFCYRPKSNLSMQKGDAGLEILDIVLSKDDPRDDLDRSNQAGFYCGSPPVRTNNPLVHDMQFGRQMQAQVFASPLGNSHGGKPSTSRVERVPSCGSSFGGTPIVRIEGFACGSSKSQCFVPALA